jgi:uncharacterized membrane protein
MEIVNRKREEKMNDKITTISAIIVVCIFWAFAIWLTWQFVPDQPRRIDCSMAEFHPDFTPEVRKACREQRRVRT